MPINLDITQNAWFKQESKKLLAEGRRQGLEQGMQLEKRSAIINLLKLGTLRVNEIAKVFSVSNEFVEEINRSIQ